jgi:hypothetical protein
MIIKTEFLKLLEKLQNKQNPLMAVSILTTLCFAFICVHPSLFNKTQHCQAQRHRLCKMDCQPMPLAWSTQALCKVFHNITEF